MKLFLTLTCAVALAGLFAVPLSVMIVQQSEKIADNIRAFNKECASIVALALAASSIPFNLSAEQSEALS